MPTYIIGSTWRSEARFSNSAGTLADPTTVTVNIKVPAGTENDYIYGTDAEVIKSAVGVYYIDTAITAAGRYVARWEGTGGGPVDAKEHFIDVPVSAFASP